MKTEMLACGLLAILAGCHHAPGRPAHTLHVTSVTPDADVEVIGELDGKVYALGVDRKDVPLYIAYWEPIDVGDVGKDFTAHFDANSGEVIVDGTDKGTVGYRVKSVREAGPN